MGMISSGSWCFGVCSPALWAVFIQPGCATLPGCVISEEQMRCPLLSYSRSVPMCFHIPLWWDHPAQSRCNLHPCARGASLLLVLPTGHWHWGRSRLSRVAGAAAGSGEVASGLSHTPPMCVCSSDALTPALAALLPWRLRVLLLGSWSIFACTLQCHEILNFPHSYLLSLISQIWLLWLLSRFIQLHCCDFLVLTL